MLLLVRKPGLPQEVWNLKREIFYGDIVTYHGDFDGKTYEVRVTHPRPGHKHFYGVETENSPRPGHQRKIKKNRSGLAILKYIP